MRCRLFGLAGLAVGLLLVTPLAMAQPGGGGGIGGGAGGNQGAGIVIDPSGVVRMESVRDPSGRLMRARIESSRSLIDADVYRSSELRKVSLTRLEAAIADRIADGKQPTIEMKHLAGLSEIRYVFLYPESGDIVLAGPAGGFASDLTGRVVSALDGSSVVLLEDVVAALRAFPPTGSKTDVIGVSIDPTPEGLANMQSFLNSIGSSVRPGMEGRIVDGLQRSLGDQIVTVKGVSPKTHFAEVMIEADYRMKLIGIGKEIVPADVGIKSFTAMSRPGEGSRNALNRWYFTPEYESLTVTDGDDALELNGPSVKLVGAGEVVGVDGTRAAAGSESRASKQFTYAFSSNYDKLAKRVPVYDQLRNVVDLSVIAAFIQKNDWYGKADWDMATFGNEDRYAIETGSEPAKIGSAVNAVWKGRTLMTPIGGGVSIRPTQTLAEGTITTQQSGDLVDARKGSDSATAPADRWWWD